MGNKAVHVDVYINEMALKQKMENLLDDNTMRQIGQLFVEMCDPYVPYLTGALSDPSNVIVREYGITYTKDYASNQYYGTEFNHTLEPHPLATALWDKVMLSERGDEFYQGVQYILERRAKELYG